MAKTFFFYDLETSGLSSRYQRIMQFAGQRTDMDLTPVGDPVDVLVRLPEDILPEPQAIIITGTTPQKTLQDGMSEPAFAKMLEKEIFTPDTVAVGFNNVRFDDEFVRHTLWRNFYDPYEWSYKDGRSRWDILDLVRMTRALRPEGIIWPVDENNMPTNRLELLSASNNLEHTHAHDALSDVEATIGMARLIKQTQPKLFEYLLSMRSKNEVAKLVNLEDPKPFVYSSGRYGKQRDFTTIAFPIAPGARPGSVLVYDLSIDPAQFIGLEQAAVQKRLFASREERQKPDFITLPVKELAYNKCPAVAPLGVVTDKTWEKLGISQEAIETHYKKLLQGQDFVDKVSESFSKREAFKKDPDVEGQLYDSFISDADKIRMSAVRAADEKTLADFHPDFVDERFPELLLRYKARNFPKSLSEDEVKAWESYRRQKFALNAPKFVETLQKIAKTQPDSDSQFLLEELQLWCESTTPIE